MLNEWISKLLYKRNLRRAAKISKFLYPYIKNNSSIIDIGSGNGYIGAQIAKDYKSDVTGIDVIDYNKSDIKFRIFDGKKIPFKDNSFDYSIIMEVLHHCDNQDEILKEASRVGRQVIVFEDIYENKFHLFFIKLYDIIGNIRHGVNIPFNFRTDKYWKNKFMEFGMELLEMETYNEHPFYIPAKTNIYLLRKKE